MKKILIADDEEKILVMYKKFLTKEGYDVVCAHDGETAVRMFFQLKDIDLVILDVMMPKMSGYEACKEIRKNSKVPIIFLTAKDTSDDELIGLDCGADEYVSKIVRLDVFLKRIENIMRRCNILDENIIEDNGIKIDFEKHVVYVDGVESTISLKEFDLLAHLIKNKGVALTRENLLKNVWDFDYFEDSRTLDTHIKKLRKKLGPHKNYIKTIWGVGYKYDPVPENEETKATN